MEKKTVLFATLFSIMLLSSSLAANYVFAASDDKDKKPKLTNCFSLGSFDAVLQCLKDASNQAFSAGSLDGVKAALLAVIKLVIGESDARKTADTNLQNQINHIQLIPGPQGLKGDKGDPATFSTQTCPTGQVMIGIKSDGTIICQSSSQTPADGTPCNDNNPNTINDVYIGGVCQGTASGQTCTTNPTPVLGDCRQVTCQNGQLITTIDNSDLPSNNGNICVTPSCNNGVPQSTPASSGTACNTSGGNVCDGAGNCVAILGCPTGQSMCSNVCTDTSSDPNNCSSCGHTCGTGAVCVSGVCTCPTGQISCQSGVCADLASDTNNCGTCGHACTAGQTCSAGACTTPVNGGACNDGNACTVNDVTINNICSGTPVTCISPPANSCVNGVLTSFAPAGICNPSTGSCNYVPTIITCTSGTCNGNACG